MFLYYVMSSYSLQSMQLEYSRYLKQVVEALESDDDFRAKLETANISDIKVNHLT